MALVVNNITKDFRDVRAVDQLSIEIREGSIFGFLGPNGAGKTTTIRMILDIIQPDTGFVTWKGKPFSQHPQGTFGYLPEERGLYPKMRVEEHLIFLGRLNGLSKRDAAQKTQAMIERFRLEEYRHKRIEELSKGNQQKVQTISTLIHEPEIVFLDEPFSGLDPVNTDLLKELLIEGNQKGQTIIFSSHRMEQVEELCQDICILNRGKLILDGNLREIKRSFGRQYLYLSVEGDQNFWRQFPELQIVNQTPEYLVFKLTDRIDTNAVLTAASQAGRVVHFKLAEPTLNQIFVSKVGEAS
ncbi:MAG: ATP-binding cassette domain-containing protein [Firmicutes bacterium]|nr:ATP-binding cassette domain-containing protein [Bacillota bacterium]